jgi:hypothetical protein
MRKPLPLPNGSESLLKAKLKQAKTKSEYQRVLCVFLRATTDLNPEHIAEMLSWNTGTVRRIQSEFIRKGDSIFCISDRGGRHNQHLTIEQEDSFLAPFIEAAHAGGVIVATDIKRDTRNWSGGKFRNRRYTVCWLVMIGDRLFQGPDIRKQTLLFRRLLKKLCRNGYRRNKSKAWKL